ncbi:E3 ubiquitin-protein ligase PUB23-like [Oryza brachyantha]|uniref:E3 ubiquitin-protein ligase PUB23-like n=1 Tax=Oryza brachyantha TaxID=4533 RepID=UPI001ADA3E0A|nr:E3 ubiquitin-protein ligase PUB23-like [Oryza brachyantha]
MDDPPHLFLCPISMELMADPVTVSTGVTYDRRSIEEWLFVYGRTTCPATMQPLSNFDLTPNHTLKRVISSWLDRGSPSSSSPSTSTLCSPIHELAAPLSQALEQERLLAALAELEETPFKVTKLKYMRACMAGDVAMQSAFVASGGVRRGSAEARLHAMDILTKISNSGGGEWTAGGDIDDVIKSLLELLSDEASTRLSSRALDVLLDVVERARGARAKAVEVGAVHVLVELLADADDRHVTERILLLLKRLCKCPEGRLAFAEHDLSVAAVARTMLRVSELSTQLAVKVLWLVSVVASSEKVLEDMMLTGAVAKLLGLLHVESAPSTKQKTVRMVRIHGVIWRQYPCFPTDFRDYLRLLD